MLIILFQEIVFYQIKGPFIQQGKSKFKYQAVVVNLILTDVVIVQSSTCSGKVLLSYYINKTKLTYLEDFLE